MVNFGLDLKKEKLISTEARYFNSTKSLELQ